ncbi:MAG: restriction endonuclease [Paucibacter sp.]|nr:restriction endonuclease [Roseateles sp.]
MAAIYDFQNLSFDDFERLCADLMQFRIGVPLESFRIGRDGGIDLRYAPSRDHTTIIQCKRYAPDAFARLYRDLESKELAKVRALAPRRYVLCTSCKLSPPQKDKLLKLLAPHCLHSGDILGADELNRIVAANPDIERRHFKLWLGSTAVLERVLNAGIFSYSEHEVETLQREISRYVVHEGFDRVLRTLDETHHCIIVGIPGVGKTTAARLLLAHYLREGYDVISVTRDVDEAWRVLSRSADAKQVIYYDDFLGQVTFSQKLEKNEDRRLLELMTHCKNSKHMLRSRASS